jgi:hypothetical protein
MCQHLIIDDSWLLKGSGATFAVMQVALSPRLAVTVRPQFAFSTTEKWMR